MKCPHCGQEHPDTFKFCPNTGQRIVPQFKACINKQCPDYGRYILPLDGRFCPSCGKLLDGWVIETDSVNDILQFVVDGVSFNMILVEHGSFMMGATVEQENPDDVEMPVHQVKITRDYYIGDTQVTQGLWKIIMGNNPSYFKDNDRPVESVSWNDCQKFLRELNHKFQATLAGKKFRLPTEAEWEFAARGGNKSNFFQYAGSNTLSDVAWYDSNSDDKTHIVAQLKPNELGIYDMSGNVFEFCQDVFGCYSINTQINPIRLGVGRKHIIRGGCWSNVARNCRLSARWLLEPDYCNSLFGFRIVLS